MKTGFMTAARATKKPEGFAGLLDSAKTAYEKPQSGDFIGGVYVGMLNAKSLYPDVLGG